MSSPQVDPDLCVIGGSEAGLAACLGAVALGLSCVLVDDGDPSGLTNPDLALVALADATAEPECHAEAWPRVAGALSRAAPDRRHARFAALNVRLVRGTGRFIDGATLRAGDQIIRARRFFIATGGRQPAWRLTAALPTGRRLVIADLARLEQPPRDVLIVGGGMQAISAAQSLARLGSRVTLAADALLPDLDPELVAPLKARLRQDGVTMLPGHLQMVRDVAGRAEATLSTGTQITATRLLLADESRPALQALDVGNAGLSMNGDNLRLDAGLRTSRRHILAIGRAAGARSSQAGVAQAGHALRSAFLPLPTRFKAPLVALVTATHPQIASVGRPCASGEGRVWRAPLAHTGGAALSGDTDGQIKVWTDRRGRVCGAGLVGSNVRDLIPFWTLTVARGLTLAQVGEVVPPTPSLSESIRAIAVQDLARRLGTPMVRRVVRAARWFG